MDIVTLKKAVKEANKYTDSVKSGELVASYEFNGNKEIHVTDLDISTGTFTSEGHGLKDGDNIWITLNKNVLPTEIKRLPNPIITGWNFVLNATENTFQVENDSGSKVEFIDNPDIDFSKFHFESGSVTTGISITELPPKKDYRVVILSKSSSGANNIYRLLPNFVPNEQLFWSQQDTNFGLLYGYPRLLSLGHSKFFSWSETIMRNTEKVFRIEWDAISIKNTTNPADTPTIRQYKDALFTTKSSIVNKNITEITLSFGGHAMLNGTSMEVYTI